VSSDKIRSKVPIPMNKEQDANVLKIFWPDHLRMDGGSYVVGQYIGNLAITVCTTIKSGTATMAGESATIIGKCYKRMSSIGELDGLEIALDELVVMKLNEKALPDFKAVWIIYFTAPKDSSLQFYSLAPLNLDLHQQQRTSSKGPTKLRPSLESNSICKNLPLDKVIDCVVEY
jgi:hypothetical protein